MVNTDSTKEAEDLRNILINTKKTEIHLHLEGLVSIETIWKLVNKNKLTYPGIKTKEDIKHKFAIKNLSEFLDLYINIVQNSFKTEDDIELLVKDAGDYLKSNNIVYAEIFFAPTKFVKMGLSYKKMIDILSQGADSIKKTHGMEIKYIVDVSRGFGIDNAMNNLDLTLKHKSPAVIGIGLGGSEKDGPAKEFAPVFKKARDNGLHVIAHAGEDMDSSSIWDAINYLKAERIGHGISSIKDAKLMDFLADTQIPLEVCPTSNLFTRKYAKTIQEHPIRKFFDKKMNITVNSDDPTLFSTSLIDEYMLLFRNKIFTKEEIIVLIKNNINASFLPPAEKKRLIAEIKA
ncbi:adenosine deaminase [Treponema sp. OttesenSCG-928-L16]|nr:adenosine deaminase [Treponema sp. OttesenSCG-928-L16]